MGLRHHHVLAALAAAVCLGALACSGGSNTNTLSGHTAKPAGSSTGDGSVTVFPTKVFVGVDESGSMSPAPVALNGASGTATWSSSDTSIAAVTGDAVSAKISAVKVGGSTVTVKAGSASANVTVTVLSYTSAAVASGQQEYKSAGCDGCHGGADAPDITPSGVGKHTDDQILGAAKDGQNPEGGAISEPNHKFAVSTAVVAYLRSLPAKTATPKDDN